MEELKKIIIHNDSLTIGGSEIVLINLLNSLQEKSNIELILDNKLSDHCLIHEVPKKIKISYLFSEKTEAELLKMKNRKRNLKEKLKYNYFLMKKKQEKYKTLKKVCEENCDIYIDFKLKLLKDISKIKAKKKIAWIHFSMKNTFKKEKLQKIGEQLKYYDTIIVTSEGSKKEILELYPFLENKIVRIYNFFDFDKIRKLSEKKECLSSEQEKMLKEKYCISVARLDNETKDFYTLLKAYKILKDNNFAYKLYIIGEGKGRAQIEEWIKSMGLEDKVFLMGAFKNPYVWIKNSKIFVHSSKTEAFGLVLVEAMILGIPVVSSKCPVGPEEILEKGRSGILVPVGGHKKMAEEIQNILENEKMREEKIKNAYLRIKDFHKDNIKKELEELLEINQ